MNQQKKGKLYLIPTPLAENTLDKVMTPHSHEVIKSLDYFLVENVRTARRFISSLKLNISIEALRFELLTKDTELEEVEKMCDSLLAGISMGVMSEAGCPGIADPGNLAVAFAHRHKVEVIPLAGPSSIFMALMASGFNGQSFVFHGYLPIEKDKRHQKIMELESNSFQHRQTQIFMETPYRNDQLVKDLIDCCKPFTKLCVARDISGSDQFIKTKFIRDWGKTKISLHKSPCIFLLYSD
jgi:16S rRNA (cytidine1402-2'-O)-methyltransferase